MHQALLTPYTMVQLTPYTMVHFSPYTMVLLTPLKANKEHFLQNMR